MSDAGINLARTLDEMLNIGRDKADVIAKAIMATRMEHRVTKADLKDFETRLAGEIKNLELKMSKLIVSAAVWLTGAAGTIAVLAVWSLHVWPVRP